MNGKREPPQEAPVCIPASGAVPSPAPLPDEVAREVPLLHRPRLKHGYGPQH